MQQTDVAPIPPFPSSVGRLRRDPVPTLHRVPTLRRLAVLVSAGTILLSACGSSSPTSSPGRTTDASGTPAASVAAGSAGSDSGSVGASVGAPAGVGAGTPSPATGSIVPATTAPAAATTAPAAAAGAWPFPNGLLIADRGNGRLIVINDAKQIVWKFPVAGSMPAGRLFAADDAFFAPDGNTIVANDEGRHIIYRIDIATKKVIWSYGHYRSAGSAKGYLNTPDDAYPLANGDIVVADINNCRILQIAPNKSIVRQWGTTGRCSNHAPRTFSAPNGDTPLPDGGLLITVINGARVVRLSATGKVIFDIHVPIVYPSDAQLLANGNIVVAGYTNPGAVIEVTPTGKLVWRYAPKSGSGRLNHPSLATPLPNGLVSINDDDRQRLIVIDPKTMKIVWQYGKTDVAGRGSGYLSDPDGHEPVPANVTL
jgi:outer membrane protein assembly factor BamB